MEKDFQTLQEIRQHIWKELGRASKDRHHAWRTPVLATVSGEGEVNARTVVLREVDVDQHMLRFYTDRRSPKVSELLQERNALIVFWSTRLNWQLRVRVNISVETDGPEVQALLQEACSTSQEPDTVHHFALLSAHVQDLDWLELRRGGHRRARFHNDTAQWLTP
jgi:pyridoxamine 5'-phosphate oxidase